MNYHKKMKSSKNVKNMSIIIAHHMLEMIRV